MQLQFGHNIDIRAKTGTHIPPTSPTNDPSTMATTMNGCCTSNRNREDLPIYETLYQDTVVSRRHLFPITALTCLSLAIVTMTGWMSYERFEKDGKVSGREYLHHSPLRTDMSDDSSRWCVLDGVQRFPTGPDEWFSRTPAFLILGDGQGLASELIQSGHPLIAPPQDGLETGNFYSTEMMTATTTTTTATTPMDAPTGQAININENDNNDNPHKHIVPPLFYPQPEVHVKNAREFLWKQGGYPSGLIAQHDHLHSFEVSSQYLFDSIDIMPRLFCVCPWIKLVVVLRDPIDRLWENYLAIAATYHRTTLEALIEQEYDMLEPFLDSPADSPEEERNWREYLAAVRRENHPALIGRSLYDVQIRFMARAMQDLGIDATKHLMVLRYEDTVSATEPNSNTNNINNDGSHKETPSTASSSSTLDDVTKFLFKDARGVKLVKKLSKSQSAKLRPLGDRQTNNKNSVPPQQHHRMGQVIHSNNNVAAGMDSASSNVVVADPPEGHRQVRSVKVPPQMDPSTRALLKQFFEYYNQRLARLLEWNDPWPIDDGPRKLTAGKSATHVYRSLFSGPV